MDCFRDFRRNIPLKVEDDRPTLFPARTASLPTGALVNRLFVYARDTVVARVVLLDRIALVIIVVARIRRQRTVAFSSMREPRNCTATVWSMISDFTNRVAAYRRHGFSCRESIYNTVFPHWRRWRRIASIEALIMAIINYPLCSSCQR